MSYKTILVHLDRESHAKERIRIACQMAIAEDAFLIGAAIAAGFIVLGWKMACKAQEQDEKKNPK